MTPSGFTARTARERQYLTFLVFSELVYKCFQQSSMVETTFDCHFVQEEILRDGYNLMLWQGKGQTLLLTYTPGVQTLGIYIHCAEL